MSRTSGEGILSARHALFHIRWSATPLYRVLLQQPANQNCAVASRASTGGSRTIVRPRSRFRSIPCWLAGWLAGWLAEHPVVIVLRAAFPPGFAAVVFSFLFMPT